MIVILDKELTNFRASAPLFIFVGCFASTDAAFLK